MDSSNEDKSFFKYLDMALPPQSLLSIAPSEQTLGTPGIVDIFVAIFESTNT